MNSDSNEELRMKNYIKLDKELILRHKEGTGHMEVWGQKSEVGNKIEVFFSPISDFRFS